MAHRASGSPWFPSGCLSLRPGLQFGFLYAPESHDLPEEGNIPQVTLVERRRPPVQRAMEYQVLRAAVSDTLSGVWVGIDPQVHEWAVDLIAAALYVEGFILTEH